MSTKEMDCIICGKTASIKENILDVNKKRFFDCKYCGKFYELDSLKQFFDKYYVNFYKSNFYKVSSWIREQNDLYDNVPLLTNEKFEEILTLRDKKIQDKFNLLISYLNTINTSFSFYEDSSVEVDTRIVRTNEELYLLVNSIRTKCYIKDFDELVCLFQKATDEKFIDCTIRNYRAIDFKKLTFDGIRYLEELEEPNKNSKKIFVAFNFDEPLTNIFNNNLKEAIEFEGFEYVVVNQDNVEHNKSINDEIIVKLKASRIVIADFTNHRNSVYFEAGFAMGMNIPIIWTCQKGHENNMSFDTRQFPHIVWEDKDDLVEQVINRLKRLL
ncbi:nucleoside 2-deoxyribosyltransferase [Aliarcobacter cryaerophilus]|uniref:nucleoside 2-deoxyribosyltransferase n=1 Tax=Aliarcobacter cryaerophilus TaxID=28198 RepID=UPI0021B53DC3|nr:nucleoside 2-deoxyribosyltransferase [Aliarcobacter cryaerophilus]MCT7546619.1 nucleoside 2-deoxyribosyltransferase [Aliarcobacter cryaerophilus]